MRFREWKFSAWILRISCMARAAALPGQKIWLSKTGSQWQYQIINMAQTIKVQISTLNDLWKNDSGNKKEKIGLFILHWDGLIQTYVCDDKLLFLFWFCIAIYSFSHVSTFLTMSSWKSHPTWKALV